MALRPRTHGSEETRGIPHPAPISRQDQSERRVPGSRPNPAPTSAMAPEPAMK